MHHDNTVVISPHLDDAVFGCGDLLTEHPHSWVITVFAGGPAQWGRPTDWDRRAGFVEGENAVRARQEEDRAALEFLRAKPVWLPFWDSQYGRVESVNDVRRALDNAIFRIRADRVFMPLGLWHSDHRLVQAAALMLPRRHPAVTWFAYEDAIYRRFHDADVQGQLNRIRRLGVQTLAVGTGETPASAVKRRAIACYGSQLRALGGVERPGWSDALQPERYWRLVPGQADS